MLTQGVFFDSHNLRRLPFNRYLVIRVFQDLVDSGIIMRSTPKRKYVFTRQFLDGMKQEATKIMPRRIFVHFPDFAVFDISGMEEWTEEELDLYVRKFRDHWLLKVRAKEPPRRSD
jgi:hypothetical protein